MKTLIIAPHVDDEVIGCWSILQQKHRDITVHYLYEWEDRIHEGIAAARTLGYTIAFELPTDLSKFEEIYVPTRRDGHADHQKANALYCGVATHYYSVDMHCRKPVVRPDLKKLYLDDLFPSQKDLWAYDAKYYLFEDIRTTDYDVYAVINTGHTKNRLVCIAVTTLIENAQWVKHNWDPFLEHPEAQITDCDLKILQANCSGKLTVKTPKYTYEVGQ